MDDLRYPIGKFEAPGAGGDARLPEWLRDIEQLPSRLAAQVLPLTPAQLATPYRPDGWTVQELVHHVADSHMNAYIRCKWTLTEDRPTIKAYDQDGWAATGDVKNTPVSVSLQLLDALHQRWTHLLRSLTPAERAREFVHPEMQQTLTLTTLIALYSWHSRHHFAHIEHLARREGWQ